MWFEHPDERWVMTEGHLARRPEGPDEAYRRAAGTLCRAELPSGAPYRQGKVRELGWICTREPGHSGKHVAHWGRDQVIAVWRESHANWEIDDDDVV